MLSANRCLCLWLLFVRLGLRRRREIAVYLLGSSDARPCLGRAPGRNRIRDESCRFMEIGLEVSKTLESKPGNFGGL